MHTRFLPNVNLAIPSMVVSLATIGVQRQLREVGPTPVTKLER
ncbi:MAG TPA: hypothetical protein VGI85_08750 [Chthoniobacterales bacterium]|jgi:hypothetical protein